MLMKTLAPVTPPNPIRRDNSLPRRLQSIVQVVFPYFLAAIAAILIGEIPAALFCVLGAAFLATDPNKRSMIVVSSHLCQTVD